MTNYDRAKHWLQVWQMRTDPDERAVVSLAALLEQVSAESFERGLCADLVDDERDGAA